MDKGKTAYSLTAILLFIIVTAVVAFHGNSRRLFASGKTNFTVESPEKAYEVWKEGKVKGRILLLFDDYPHMRGFYAYGGIPQLDRSNLVEFSVFRNVIRKIYFIVPDQDWEEFRKQEEMHPIRMVPGMDRAYYLYTMSGTPVIATTPTSLPALAEKPLVYINDKKFDYEKTIDLLLQKKIAGDIIIRYHADNL